MAISMENICRTCMNEEIEMISLFDSAIEDNSLADILINCTSVEVDRNDGLPRLICKNCLVKLTTAFNFKCQCEEIDTTLRELAMTTSVEFVEVKDSSVEKAADTEQEPTEEVVELKEEVLEEPSYECSTCNTLFKTHQEFINHEDACGEQLNICEKCGEMRQSSKDHKCSQIFECKKCDIRFVSKVNYMSHKKQHRKIYKCEKCDREFRSHYGYKYHMSVHGNEKKHVCSVCNKRFLMKQSLSKHMGIHAAERGYLCSLCGAAFTTHDTLAYHLKTHGGRRPHLCPACGKTFKQMSHLSAHMWVHQGVKPHTCVACGKTYTTRHKLKKHLATNCKEH